MADEIVVQSDETIKFEKLEGGKLAVPAGGSVLDTILKQSSDDLRPWATVTLPSRGRYYSNEIPGGVVRVRPMGMAADKILATQRLAQSGKSLDYLFKNCVDLPNKFSPFNLIAGDRVFLLYYLRGITHGNMYEFAYECSSCESKNDMQYDMNNLSSSIQWDNGNLGEEPFKVILPHLSSMTGTEVWVKVRFLRGYDLLKMTQEVKRSRRVKPKFQKDVADTDSLIVDETLSSNLANLIVEIGSGAEHTSDQASIVKLVNSLHSSDHAIIREFLSDNMPGIDTEVGIECVECGAAMKMPLPITESFFRPSKQVDKGR